MPSIDDFINHCWADAKEELRQLDPAFVSQFEHTVQLENLGLMTPWQLQADQSPKQRLASKWHRLLETCDEFAMQVSILRTATTSFIADSKNGEIPKVEAGMRFVYHGRSWVIHAEALAERTRDVINKTIELYIPDSKVGNNVAKRHRDSVYTQVTEYIKEQRNQYVHPSRALAKGITQNNMWEGCLALGITPPMKFHQFVFPVDGDKELFRIYDGLIDGTEQVCARIGSILHELEDDIIGYKAQYTGK